MARVAEWFVDDFHTQGLANTAWGRATVGQLLSKVLPFCRATELFFSGISPPADCESSEAVLNCEEKSEQTILPRKVMESVNHHDFKRLCALQNWVWESEKQQFLVHGGREIKAALDAEYPILEIWVAEQAVQNLA